MKLLKIYIAAPWVCGGVANGMADSLRDHGFEVTASWLKRARKNLNMKYDYNVDPKFTKRISAREARKDIKDIKKSDILVVYNLEKSEGKVVEQGIAHAMGKKIIILGPKTNVFQNLPNVTIVPVWEQVLKLLERLQGKCASKKKKKNI